MAKKGVRDALCIYWGLDNKNVELINEESCRQCKKTGSKIGYTVSKLLA